MRQLEILCLFGQHFTVADDRIHRRSQFMTHVRQKLTLGSIRGFRLLAQQLQLLLALADFGLRQPEAAAHVIKGFSQAPQFVLAHHRNFVFQVARRECIGSDLENLKATLKTAGHTDSDEAG